MPPSSIIRRITALFFATVLLSNLCAALSWETQKIERTTKPGDKEVVALFRFKNPKEIPVTVESIQTSCGCTTAELPKKTYGPGESGELKVVFTIGERTGPQEKTIEIATLDAPFKPDVLTLQVQIPVFVTAEPKMLWWRIGEDPQEKSVLISAAPGQEIISMAPTLRPQSGVTVRVESLEAGRKFRVYVKPVATILGQHIVIPCEVRFVDGVATTLTLYAMVK